MSIEVVVLEYDWHEVVSSMAHSEDDDVVVGALNGSYHACSLLVVLLNCVTGECICTSHCQLVDIVTTHHTNEG